MSNTGVHAVAPCDSDAARHEFMMRQLTPLMRALVLTGTAGYAMFVFGIEWVVTDSGLLWARLTVLGLMVVISLTTVPAAVSRHWTLGGSLFIGLLELGNLLNALPLADAASWLLPGFLLIPITASIGWLNSRDVVIGLLLALAGPVAAWWLLQPDIITIVQALLYLTLAIGAAIVIHTFTQWQLRAQFDLQKRLANIAYTDALTGIANRAQFFNLSNEAVAHAQSNGTSMCALFIDVDNFKLVNDQFGHAAGDEALTTVAATLQSQTRQGDILGRIGGEEFAMSLPDTGLGHATGVAERLRDSITALNLSCGPLSVSVGLAQLHHGDQSIDGILAAADQALRRAKRNGRNRLEVASARASDTADLHLVSNTIVSNESIESH